MKIGLISDIHSNYYCLNRVLSDMDEVDKIVCCGDLIGYGLSPNKTINKIKEKADIIVKGNHDRYLENPRFTGSIPRYSSLVIKNRNREWLSYLKDVKEIDGYLVTHKLSYNDLKNSDLYKEYDLSNYKGILFGHSHKQLNKREGNLHFINPGNVGVPRPSSWNIKPSYALLDTTKREVKLKNISIV